MRACGSASSSRRPRSGRPGRRPRVRPGGRGARLRPPARLRPRARRRRLRTAPTGPGRTRPSTSSTRSSSSSATWPRSAPGLELVAGVLVLPQRQTALVAKQAAEVDLLTGGRFRLGVGLGWNFVEFEALGEDFTNRGRRSEEQIEVLRRLWTEPVVDFDGRWHRIPRPGSTRCPCSGRSRSGSAARPRRRSGGPHGSRTGSSRSGRSTAAGRRRSSASGAGSRRPAATRTQIGIEWRIDVVERHAGRLARRGRRVRAARRDALLAWRRCAAASTSTATSPASGSARSARIGSTCAEDEGAEAGLRVDDRRRVHDPGRDARARQGSAGREGRRGPPSSRSRCG